MKRILDKTANSHWLYNLALYLVIKHHLYLW